MANTNLFLEKNGRVLNWRLCEIIKWPVFTVETSTSLVIRTCVLENMDSQCGMFKFEGEALAGCILTCNTDGCNTSSSLGKFLSLIFSSVIAILLAK